MRAKRCRGQCGLVKVLEMFYRNGRGNPQNVCKECHRIVARESARRRYALRREALAARKRDEYRQPGKREVLLKRVAVYDRRTRPGVALAEVA